MVTRNIASCKVLVAYTMRFSGQTFDMYVDDDGDLVVRSKTCLGVIGLRVSPFTRE